MEYTSPRAAGVPGTPAGLNPTFADLARQVGSLATRGAKLGSAATVAQTMGAVLMNNLPGVPEWVQKSKIASTAASLVAPVALLGVVKFFPKQIPSPDKLESLANYAIEGYVAVQFGGWLSGLYPTLADFVKMADALPADDEQV